MATRHTTGARARFATFVVAAIAALSAERGNAVPAWAADANGNFQHVTPHNNNGSRSPNNGYGYTQAEYERAQVRHGQAVRALDRLMREYGPRTPFQERLFQSNLAAARWAVQYTGNEVRRIEAEMRGANLGGYPGVRTYQELMRAYAD